MAASLTGLTIALKVGMSGTVTKTRDHQSVSGSEFQFSKNKDVNFSFGTGAGKGNCFVNDERELAGSATEDLDLAGSLSDAFGDTVTFSKIRALLITNDSDERDTPTAAEIHIGGAAATQFAGMFGAVNDELVIPAGGAVLLLANDADGYTCTGGASDLLKIEEVAALACTYSILAIGESA